MNIKARRVNGSEFSSEARLEVVFDSENQQMFEVVHTVELVSGVSITHGGGAPASIYLHYKSPLRDANDAGIIDYSSVEMAVMQDTVGTSVIKVVCNATTQADFDVYSIAYGAWKERQVVAVDAKEEFTEENPILNVTTLKTGVITLTWKEDGFV
jgi:hypothetical protein